MKTVTFIVSDMHCPACVMRLEGLEDVLAGVKRVTASYQKQSVLVEFDELKISIPEIRQAVAQMGYTPKES
jgi:copper chaperone CopZ